METKVYHVLDYNEFEKLIKKHYPYIEGYEFVPYQECSNDSSHTFDNITAEHWDQYDEEQWEVDITQNKDYYFTAEVFLKKLVKDRHIEPGNYLIDVCW